MKKPNQALEPTTTSVTPPAGARVAPAAVVAHLERSAKMSLFARFRRKARPMVRRHIADEIVGALQFDDEGWFVGSVRHGSTQLSLSIAAGESDIDAASLATARALASQLSLMIEHALGFLATFPGFLGIERVRAMFIPREVVCDGEEGSFYLVFHCTEDRDPEARWRVHYRSWQPFSQGRDS